MDDHEELVAGGALLHEDLALVDVERVRSPGDQLQLPFRARAEHRDLSEHLEADVAFGHRCSFQGRVPADASAILPFSRIRRRKVAIGGRSQFEAGPR